jgi:hypothetical protein
MPGNRNAVALIAVIKTAFPDASEVDREALVYEGSWETTTLKRDLTAVSDMPDDWFIESHAGSLPVFRPEGLRHVLPYYMAYSVRHTKSDVTERLIFHLSPADARDEYWRERLSVFTSTHKRAIREYLRFMQSALAGEHYDVHLSRAVNVWESPLSGIGD